MNGYQARKINEIIYIIFCLQLWEIFLSIKAEVGMFTKLSMKIRALSYFKEKSETA